MLKGILPFWRTITCLFLCAQPNAQNIVWCEDNAPSHVAKVTVAWRKSFWPFQHVEWPPSSPDLNPLDYMIWSEMAKPFKGIQFASVQELKVEIGRRVVELNGNPEFLASIQKAMRAFPARLQKCLNSGGGHFES